MRNVKLSRQWFLWNSIAWLAGFIFYSPIAHGITGGHSRDFTTAQLIAHSIGYAVVGLIVALAHRRVLAPYVRVTWARVILAPILFIIASWVGTFQTYINGPDTDILLGFFVLGAAVWFGNVPMKGHLVATAVALLSFPIASFVAELLLFVTFTLLEITPALQTSEFQHSLFWIVVGGVSGSLGGWLSGLALGRMVPSVPGDSAAS